MGKLEKVVVLFVLFLVALILGVSLNAPDGVAAAETSEVLAAAERERAPARAPIQRNARAAESRPDRDAPVTRTSGRDESLTPAPRSVPAETGRGAQADRSRAANLTRVAEVPAGEGQREPAGNQPLGPAGLLSTARPASAAVTPAPSVERAAGAASAEAAEAGDGTAYLHTLKGLTPSLSEEFMIYAWQDGDTFTAVAERYFGSKLHVNRLLRNNEGLEDRHLRPGDQILIPVRATEPVAAEGGDEWSGATTYMVQSGDVLGTISNTVYGTSKNWRKIYDANRDLLADPNRLVVGMVLRIPE